MHHLGVKSSNLVDVGRERNKLGFGSNDVRPVCPKPRRLGIAVPEFLKPLRCKCNHHSQPNSDGRSKILNMVAEKTIEGRECLCTGCLQSCYSGSPPGRTENPLVHDVNFINQTEPFAPLTRNKFGLTSASPI